MSEPRNVIVTLNVGMFPEHAQVVIQNAHPALAPRVVLPASEITDLIHQLQHARGHYERLKESEQG